MCCQKTLAITPKNKNGRNKINIMFASNVFISTSPNYKPRTLDIVLILFCNL